MKKIVTRNFEDVYPVYLDIEERWNRERYEEWCSDQFGLIGIHWWNDVDAEWNGYTVDERFVFYFVNKEHAILFALRWV